jgi:beta-galactosidase/beta-glucuronidase
MWYTPVSGIWQTVWLESLAKNYIRGIKINADKTQAHIAVDADGIKKLTLKETGENYDFSGNEITICPENPKTWQPEAPFLYEFTLECGEDRVESYFALREIGSASDGDTSRLTLNGKPYLFSGLLDQGYFPDGIFLPATPDGYREDILAAKKMGFNMLRKHIKIEPMIFYHLCDTLGIAVFQDMVNNGSYSFFFDTALPTVGVKRLPEFRNRNRETRKIFINHMLDTAKLLYNTPSVVEYTVFNEGWGQFKADDAYKTLKEFDTTRVIDATSGWFEGRMTDFNSKHIYFRIPTVKSINNRPLFLSEFGGYSLRIDGHLFGKDNYGYKLYPDEESFTEAVRELYTEGVLPLIEKGLSATVYTQLSDVEDETNGLLTYDRRVMKIKPEIMRSINESLYSKLEKLTAE